MMALGPFLLTVHNILIYLEHTCLLVNSQAVIAAEQTCLQVYSQARMQGEGKAAITG